MTNKHDDVAEVDLLRLLRALMCRAWLIILVMVLSGALALGGTHFLVTPLYESSVLMYINSSNISLGGAKLSLSQGDLAAAQSLIDTYAVILKTRATLNDVIEEAELDCSYSTLLDMISTEAVDGTEVFKITITNPDPVEGTLIANTIAQVLPEKIASIVEGTSARIVDMAVIPGRPASPNRTINTIVGMLVGGMLICALVVIRELMDDKVYDEEFLIEAYELPVLAKIPDLTESAREKGSYYYQSAGHSQRQ